MTWVKPVHDRCVTSSEPPGEFGSTCLVAALGAIGHRLPTKRRRGTTVSRVMVAWSAVLIGFSGCSTSGPHTPSGPTHIDRLMQHYGDVERGRLLILADFERPEHMELVGWRGSAGPDHLVLRPHAGRRETGGGALSFRAASGYDGVVFSNAGASQWYLKRDWRAYDLLLLSVHVPARRLTAEVILAGGAVANRLETQTSIPLDRGWNVLRLDLAEIGEHVPLDDIASLTLSVSGQDRPIEVLVDDILLTGNRANLLGNPDGSEGELYVQRVGKRLRIGSKRPGSEFEITMANGQIVAWYHIATDPNRLHNLVRGTSLGPNPVRSEPGLEGIIPARVARRCRGRAPGNHRT